MTLTILPSTEEQKRWDPHPKDGRERRGLLGGRGPLTIMPPDATSPFGAHAGSDRRVSHDAFANPPTAS